MLGAIIGDIIGSIYERINIKTTEFRLFQWRCRPTDDSVMTLAVAQALLDTRGQDTEKVNAALVKEMQRIGRRYPDAGYGGRFISWLDAEDPRPYGSYGNGSAMRVSAAGWLYPTLEETRRMAALTASVTHNHPEGVKGAESVASAIFLARTGAGKAEIKAYIEANFGYELDTPLDVIRPGYKFDVSCQGSVPQAIRAFLEGTDYESTVRLAVSIGGDSDTIACIAGGMAEAMYGVPEEIREVGLTYLPEDLRLIFERFRKECEAYPY